MTDAGAKHLLGPHPYDLFNMFLSMSLSVCPDLSSVTISLALMVLAVELIKRCGDTLES